jgi:hypothetical protein
MVKMGRANRATYFASFHQIPISVSANDIRWAKPNGFVLSEQCCRYSLPLGSFGNHRSIGWMALKTAQLAIGFVSQLRYEAIGLFAEDGQGRIGFPCASVAAEFEAGLPRIEGSGDDLPESFIVSRPGFVPWRQRMMARHPPTERPAGSPESVGAPP